MFSTILRNTLQVEPQRTSNVIRLTYEGQDPKLITDILNAYTQVYLDLTINLRVEPVKQYSDWFQERLKTLRDDVEEKQAKLSEYQRVRGLVGNDQRADIESQRLDALMSQLVSVQGENMAINSRQKTSNDELSPDVQANSVVQGVRQQLNSAQDKLAELKLTLGPNHPQRIQLEEQIGELKAQLARETSRVIGGTGVAKNTANYRESELKAAIAAQKEKVLSLKAQRDELAVLSQDVEAAKKIYDSVLQRSNQLNLEKQTEQTNVSVLSPAVEPTSPAKPDVVKYLLGSLVAAFGAGIGAALGIELLGRKVRVEQDIMIEDIPLLGVLQSREDAYSWKERLALLRTFFAKRKQRKDREEIVAQSRLAGLQ